MSDHGLAATPVVIAVLLLAVVTGGVLIVARGEGGGAQDPAADVYQVGRGAFDITVPASGELAALRQIEVASRLEARATITYIVDEGVAVSEGDVLIRLNDEEILDKIKDSKDAVDSAQTAWVTAKSNLEIRKHSNASELAKADLAIRLAELALKAWEHGDDLTTRRRLELEVETAQKDRDRVVDRFEASRKLLAQEFISADEFRRDEIEMIKAESRLEQAVLEVKVYEEYRHEQERAKYESDLQQARDERVRIGQRHENEINSLTSDVKSRAFQLQSKRERLDKYRNQLELCTIRAPQDGLVVYMSSLDGGRRGRGDGQPPQVGTELRRNEPVIVLPDTSAMIAEVKVNEALSGRIEPGQRAVVYSDALPDHPLPGEVLSVGVLAETGGWRDPNRRDYTVRIKLLEVDGLGLKPSMRARASIFVDDVIDALHVPIQAVFRSGPQAIVYVPDGSGYAQRQVRMGRASELYVEILEGLGDGDQVLTREPPAERITSRLDTPAADRVASAHPRSDGQAKSRAEGRAEDRTPGKGRPAGRPGVEGASAAQTDSGAARPAPAAAGKPGAVRAEGQAASSAGS